MKEDENYPEMDDEFHEGDVRCPYCGLIEVCEHLFALYDAENRVLGSGFLADNEESLDFYLNEIFEFYKRHLLVFGPEEGSMMQLSDQISEVWYRILEDHRGEDIMEILIKDDQFSYTSNFDYIPILLEMSDTIDILGFYDRGGPGSSCSHHCFYSNEDHRQIYNKMISNFKFLLATGINPVKYDLYFTPEIPNDHLWMTKNLNVSNFRNGDPIPEARTKKEWISAAKKKTPAYCYYNNDPENENLFGKLYNYYAFADPRGLAPRGWRLPLEKDWNELIVSLGGKGIAGGRIKQNGTDLWKHPNEGASNDINFSGLPGGLRSLEGNFYGFNYIAGWWQKEEKEKYRGNKSKSKYHYLLSNRYSVLFKWLEYEGAGMSVRCVKKKPKSLAKNQRISFR